MTAMLAFCVCGHTADEHRAGAACQHVNHDTRADSAKPEVRAKARTLDEPCTCARFRVNDQVADPAEFVAKTLNHIIRKEGIPDVSRADREDLSQVMLTSLWQAAGKYDSRSHIRFGSYASFEVYNDAIDEIRSARMFGRHGQHRLPAPVRLEGDEGEWNFEKRDPLDELDDDAAGSRRLERAVTGITVDATDVGALSLEWALAASDRLVSWAIDDSRGRSDRGAQDGASGPSWAAGLAALTSTEEEAAA